MLDKYTLLKILLFAITKVYYFQNKALVIAVGGKFDY
jgi:hypothetical protein